MKTEHINHLLNAPSSIASEDVQGLHQLVKDYPWCQSFQVLYAKALKQSDDPTFNKQLKKTAVYATDRKILYRLIMQPGLQKSIANFEALVSAPHETKEEEQLPSPPVTQLPEKTGSGEKETADPVQPESDDIDSRNLEQEVLKEVAAHAYQLDFERSTAEQDEKGASEKDAETEPEEQPVSTETTSDSDASAPAGEMTFLDFITGRKISPTPATNEHAVPPQQAVEEDNLIERFIKNEPKIERKKASFFSPVNMGKMSLVDNDEVVSETLATIYAKQGDIEKAKKAYQQLALKYPEKSIYFAGLIKKLEQSRK